MIGNRLDLHSTLQRLLVEHGGGMAKNVYFQPPESIRMSYPAITYELNDVSAQHANNHAYFTGKGYQVTFMTKDPDVDLSKEFEKTFKFCRFSRSYASQNLNHYVYTIYY